MARARDPNRDRAFEAWKESGGSIDLVKIAEQLGVSPGTVRGWKSKDKWDANMNGTLQSKERSAQKNAERSKGKKERSKAPLVVENINDGLADKHKLFAAEYLRDFNATRAAMFVGYKKNYAHDAGWRLLKKAEVQAEIKRLREERETDLALDVRRIMSEYMKIAFADITDLLVFGQKEETIRGEDGKPILNPETGEPLTYKRNYVSFRESDEVDSSVISEVKQGKGGVSIKLHDKLRALEKLERYVSYMTEEERLKMDKMRAEIAVLNGGGDGKEEGDDGFIDALKGKVSDAWDDETDDTDKQSNDE